MPGPVSDSYDPEFGTRANADSIAVEMRKMHREISRIMNDVPPLCILDLVASTDLDKEITATLTERQWRLLRFATERAAGSL